MRNAKHAAPAKGSNKTLIYLSVVLGVAVLGGALAFFALGPGKSMLSPTVPDGKVTEEQNAQTVEQKDPADASHNEALPFKLVGVDDSADVIDAASVATQSSYTTAWTFGGDFSLIGSLPVSTSQVFGSFSDSPYDLESYAPALLSESGNTALDEVASDPYFEPRDGSGDASRLVWTSSTLNEAYQNGIDNWRLSYWDAQSNSTQVLGSAQDINGTDQTPALPGETVPTMNSEHVYFSSNVKSGEDWVPSILEFALDGSKDYKVVAAGGFAYAIDGGVLYATDTVVSTDSELGYSSVKELLGDKTVDVLTVDSADSGWCVSGLWAYGDVRVAAFSHAREQSGCYLGIWSNNFEKNIAWLKVSSSSVVGSIGDGLFVWGSGSQDTNTEMYAVNVDDPADVKLLGSALGYSRPAVAQDGSAILVPEYDGTDEAVKFNLVAVQ